MSPNQVTQHGQSPDRVLSFLQRDPYHNFHVASTLIHESARVVGFVESGEAPVGVAIAAASAPGRPPLVRLDALGPIAFRRLMATMRIVPQRMMLHRPWMTQALDRELGPVHSRFAIEMYASPPEMADRPLDARVAALTANDVTQLQAKEPSWLLNVVTEHLARGWRAFAIVESDTLVALACCGFPTGSLEEICHVFTAPERRGRGLAGAVINAAVQSIRARGMNAVYFSRVANVASLRAAERCGLRRIASLEEVALGA